MASRLRFLPIIVLFLVFFGGVWLIVSLPRETDQVDDTSADEVTHNLSADTGGLPAALEPGYYTLFSLNVHDWTHPEESAATVERVLDIHEQYGVPIDIYVTDPIFQLYVENNANLLDRLRASEVATVAYHIRPPVPYYPSFDWFGLSSLSDDTLYDELYAYETHALDLATGEYTDEPGGYAYVKEVMGYAPISVGVIPGGSVGDALERVYANLGATFVVVHGRASALGDAYGTSGLFKRPEDADVKIYEYAKLGQDGGDVLEEYMQEEILDGPYFLGIKYHENDFYYTGGTPWWYVFYSSSPETKKEEEGATFREPPFPLELANSLGRMESEEAQALDWALYESAVKYVAEHPTQITPLNLRMLLEILEN